MSPVVFDCAVDACSVTRDFEYAGLVHFFIVTSIMTDHRR